MRTKTYLLSGTFLALAAGLPASSAIAQEIAPNPAANHDEVEPASETPPVPIEGGEESKSHSNAEVAADADLDASQMSSDEIFRRMFGRDMPSVGQNRYTVILDGINVGEALIDPSEEGWIEADFLRQKVLPLLLPDAADQLRPLLEQNRVPFATLRSFSYEMSFDRRDLVFTLVIPFDLRGERAILLGARPNTNVVDFIPQASFSAYLSMRGGLDWIQDNPIGLKGLSGFVMDFDAAINFKGIVLEGEFRYDENSRRSFSRRDVRLTYDDVDSLIRYEAGDLSIGRRPFQNAPKIAGLAAYREYGIDPYTDPRPVGERGLVLDRPAQVEVIVNGARVRYVNLPAGRYSLRDFPIVPGAINDVEFVVTYASGEVERFVFAAFSSISLLEKGRTEFAMNVGVPYDDIDNVRTYDTSDFNAIGFVRHGLSSTLTAGVSVEASKDLLLVGAEATWASPIGSFDLNVSNNLRNPGIDSGRISLQYAWRSKDPFQGTSVDALIILTGSEYETLDRLFDGPSSSIFASARVNHILDDVTRVSFGASYQKSGDDEDEFDTFETWTVSGGVSRSFGTVNASASVDYTSGGPRGSQWAGRLNLFVPLGRGTLSSSFTTRDTAFRTDYRVAPRSAVGGFGYAGGFQISDNGDQQYARATYIGNRFEADVEQVRESNDRGTDIRTGFAFGTALVMADSTFSVSRPVQNGFAIIGNGTDIDTHLAIDPRSSAFGGKRYYGAYSDFLGPGVIPDLPPYFIRRIEVDAPDAEAGAGLGGEIFILKPGYRAGYSLLAGEAGGTVSALGNLTYSDGSPAGMLSGTVTRLDVGQGDPAQTDSVSEKEPDGMFFTNSAGRFFLEGLDPGGEYEVLLTVSRDPQRFVLTVPEDAFGIWRIEQSITIEGSAPESSVIDGSASESGSERDSVTIAESEQTDGAGDVE